LSEVLKKDEQNPNLIKTKRRLHQKLRILLWLWKVLYG